MPNVAHFLKDTQHSISSIQVFGLDLTSVIKEMSGSDGQKWWSSLSISHHFLAGVSGGFASTGTYHRRNIHFMTVFVSFTPIR
jgi:hypothetical protein